MSDRPDMNDDRSPYTVFCRCCGDDSPYSMRQNDGPSWDLCCDICHSIVATFNDGNPFEPPPLEVNING